MPLQLQLDVVLNFSHNESAFFRVHPNDTCPSDVLFLFSFILTSEWAQSVLASR